MTKFFLFFKILISFLILENNIAFAVTENKIIATVGNDIISSYELKNKIRTSLILNNQEINQNSINKTKNIAMISLIDYKLKEQEIIKYKISVDNNKTIKDYINRLASNYNTNASGLKKIFETNKIDFDLFEDEIISELNWQQLIFELYANKINLNEEDVEKEINQLIKKQEDIKEYKLAEIEIEFDKNDYKNKIKEIKEQIDSIGFKNTAIKFSIATSAIDGGNLDWISEKSLSEEILNVVKKMSVNDIADAFIRTNSIVFLKLLDKKTIKTDNINPEMLRKKIIDRKRNEILNLYSNNHLSKLKNKSFIKINEK